MHTSGDTQSKQAKRFVFRLLYFSTGRDNSWQGLGVLCKWRLISDSSCTLLMVPDVLPGSCKLVYDCFGGHINVGVHNVNCFSVHKHSSSAFQFSILLAPPPTPEACIWLLDVKVLFKASLLVCSGLCADLLLVFSLSTSALKTGSDVQTDSQKVWSVGLILLAEQTGLSDCESPALKQYLSCRLIGWIVAPLDCV